MISIKWYHVIIIGILAHLLFYRKPADVVQIPDVKSAIQRAKTSSCKRELEDFAKSIESIDYSTIELRRSCQLDRKIQRNQFIGCVTNSTQNIIKIEQQVKNTTECLDLCFSYGHSFAAYNNDLPTCNCWDSDGFLDVEFASFSDCLKSNQLSLFKVDNGIYYPTGRNGLKTANPHVGPIRIAFLLSLSGRDYLQVKRLVDNIYSSQHHYYIHVDRQDDYLLRELKLMYANHDNVLFASSRFRTIWGGTSLLRMILDSMKSLLREEWDYIINLSESDFPLKSLGQLESYLAKNPSSVYLKTHGLRGYQFIKKQGLEWNFYECENRLWRLGRRKLPRGIVYSGGSDWFALPREFCQYIMDNLTNSESIVKPLYEMYNHTLLPVESFFHTIALNSEFCDKFQSGNLRVTNWNRKKSGVCQHKETVDWCGSSPLVYRSSDWERIQYFNESKNLFFARKFDPTISSSIISAIEKKIKPVSEGANETDIDTRFWRNVYSFNRSSESDRLTYGPVFEQFGLFARNQTGYDSANNTRLESVDLFFNEDRFVGILLMHCSKMICSQLLVERTPKVYRKSKDCLNTEGITLNAIEISQRFDSGERLFRDYSPLNHLSDVAVYHQWMVEAAPRGAKKSTYDIYFRWIDSLNYPELVQTVKLKRPTRSSKLSLAHRLNINRPIMTGLWTLVIRDRNIDCLKYEFLLFGPSTFDESKIKQDQFDRHYKVTENCTKVRTKQQLDLSETLTGCCACEDKYWSVAIR